MAGWCRVSAIHTTYKLIICDFLCVEVIVFWEERREEGEDSSGSGTKNRTP